MGSLTHLEHNFTRVGWFIPPYMELGVLSQIAAEIEGNAQFTQRHLEDALARLYEPLARLGYHGTASLSAGADHTKLREHYL
jgi:hypothetical protein